MHRMYRFALVLLTLAYCLPNALAQGPAYTSIVIIGDSLTDTGNDAKVSYAKYGAAAQVPAPVTGYTMGRFTDGTDTLPSAKNYYGVWAEQLAAMLPNKPSINYSLNSTTPGNNYAYGFATTGTGQSTFTYPPPNTALNFQVNNMGAQLASYLATNPTITSKTLFIVWGGANDLIAAASSSNPAAAVQAAAQAEAGIVQTLINAGATDFIVPNLPPLGLVPRFNGSTSTSAPATQLAAGFDQYLAAYLAAIPSANPGKTLNLRQLDTYTLFNTIVAAPSARGFANVTASSSAAYTGVTTTNPDTYLFWDDLHPTTYGHYQLALQAYTLLGSPVATTTTLASSTSQPNPGKTFTLTASVLSASGIPTGTVTFLDGSNVLGSAYVTGSSTTVSAVLTTSYASAGTHTLTAMFTGVNGYANSTTATPVPVTVVASQLTPTLQYTSLIGAVGVSLSDTITLTLQGGYSGTATIACGTLPSHFTCSASPASISLPGTNTAVTSTITLGTNAMAGLARPTGPFDHAQRRGEEILLACGLLPGFGLLGLASLRRKRKTAAGLMLSGVLMLFAGVGALGLTGCSDNGKANIAAAGNYTVPVIVTSNGTSTTLNIAVTLQ